MNIKQLNEELDQILNEGVRPKLTRKLTAKDILEVYNKLGFYYVKEENEKHTVVKLDKNTLPNMSELLENNLRQAGKYGSYYAVPVEAVENGTVMQWLPIYGYSNRYETKWLSSNIEDAIKDDFKTLGSAAFNVATKNFEALGLNTTVVKMAIIDSHWSWILGKLKEEKLNKYLISYDKYYVNYEAKGLAITIFDDVLEKMKDFTQKYNFTYKLL